jgi:hypothetical protein
MCEGEEVEREILYECEKECINHVRHLPLRLLLFRARACMVVIADHWEGRVPVHEGERRGKWISYVEEEEIDADIYGGKERKKFRKNENHADCASQWGLEPPGSECCTGW